MGKYLNRYFPKEDKKWLKSRRKMQTKITMIYHYIPIKMAKRKKTNHTKCW